jgi:hypothetical protein
MRTPGGEIRPTPDEAADALRAILAGAPRLPSEASSGASNIG